MITRVLNQAGCRILAGGEVLRQRALQIMRMHQHNLSLNPYIHASALTPHRTVLFLFWTRTVREAVGDRLTRQARATNEGCSCQLPAATPD